MNWLKNKNFFYLYHVIISMTIITRKIYSTNLNEFANNHIQMKDVIKYTIFVQMSNKIITKRSYLFKKYSYKTSSVNAIVFKNNRNYVV